MYYLAVMDCDDEVADILGDNLNGRLRIDWWLTAGGSEYSYEMQWRFEIDCLFCAAFLLIPMLMGYEFLDFVKKTQILNSPHIYCMIAIFFQLLACVCSAFYTGFYHVDGRSH